MGATFNIVLFSYTEHVQKHLTINNACQIKQKTEYQLKS